MQEVAGREAALRREAVEKGRFVAMVDWSESEGWREDVRGRVGAMRGDGEGIGFRVLGEGFLFGRVDGGVGGMGGMGFEGV